MHQPFADRNLELNNIRIILFNVVNRIHGHVEIWKDISSVDKDISRASKVNEQVKWTSEISCSTREIISYFQASMYCSVYYIKK